MNRRDFLSTAFIPSKPSALFQPKGGLEPYTGSWGYAEAAHLLRRTMFGARKADVQEILSGSPTQAVDRLLVAPPPPSPLRPIKYLGDGSDYPGDPSDWTRLKYVDPTTDQGWFTFLQTWYLKQMLEQPISITEKMILFWHNHFSSSFNTVKDARCMYQTHAVLRQNALGNVKEMVKQITIDPGMLRYLNGNTNTKSGPNENYGRELQELFTIGKGPEISPGNYTTYTEADVKTAARVLTGWKDFTDNVTSIYTDSDHDSTDKKFSSAYSDTVIKGRSGQDGALAEIDDLLTMIFAQEATARYICRKVYSWFVCARISEETEQKIIKPLAKIFQDNNFEIQPVLKTLFTSAHFYDPKIRGAIVKNPIDLGVALVRSVPVDTLDVAGNPDDSFPSKRPQLPSDFGILHYALRPFRVTLAGMQYDLLNPPSVAGYPAYYQTPQYEKIWINADTLQRRVKLVDDLIVTKFNYEAGYGFALVNAIALAKQTSAPANAGKVQEELIEMLFAVPIKEEVRKKARTAFLGEEPDTAWADRWNAYMQNPENRESVAVVDKHLRSFLRYVCGLAEFQLS